MELTNLPKGVEKITPYDEVFKIIIKDVYTRTGYTEEYLGDNTLGILYTLVHNLTTMIVQPKFTEEIIKLRFNDVQTDDYTVVVRELIRQI